MYIGDDGMCFTGGTHTESRISLAQEKSDPTARTTFFGGTESEEERRQRFDETFAEENRGRLEEDPNYLRERGISTEKFRAEWSYATSGGMSYEEISQAEEDERNRRSSHYG